MKSKPGINCFSVSTVRAGAISGLVALGSLVAMLLSWQRLRKLRRELMERQRSEAYLAQQAFSDCLTGLPNRALFLDRLKHALARSARHNQSVAVLFVDLDGFKEVNDSFGHAAGDQLLTAAAQRLASHLRREDTLARFGGDEFTILLEGVTSVQDVTCVAERILDSLRTPFTIGTQQVSVMASIGIALSAAGAHEVDALLRQADEALYRAKAQGRGSFAAAVMTVCS